MFCMIRMYVHARSAQKCFCPFMQSVGPGQRVVSRVFAGSGSPLLLMLLLRLLRLLPLLPPLLLLGGSCRRARL